MPPISNGTDKIDHIMYESDLQDGISSSIIDGDVSSLNLSITDNEFAVIESRSGVNRRLAILVEYGLVTRVKRGYYEITEQGSQYLAGELDASTLDGADSTE